VYGSDHVLILGTVRTFIRTWENHVRFFQYGWCPGLNPTFCEHKALVMTT